MFDFYTMRVQNIKCNMFYFVKRNDVDISSLIFAYVDWFRAIYINLAFQLTINRHRCAFTGSFAACILLGS